LEKECSTGFARLAGKMFRHRRLSVRTAPKGPGNTLPRPPLRRPVSRRRAGSPRRRQRRPSLRGSPRQWLRPRLGRRPGCRLPFLRPGNPRPRRRLRLRRSSRGFLPRRSRREPSRRRLLRRPHLRPHGRDSSRPTRRRLFRPRHGSSPRLARVRPPG
jgi:hypothetical protein